MTEREAFEEWIKARDTALLALDMEWARKLLPEATSDHIRLMAMHKARYDCTSLPTDARHKSGQWLRQHEYGRLDGTPLLPEGVLPSSTKEKKND